MRYRPRHKTKDIWRKLFSCLALLLFLWYLGGTSLFQHSHIIDGQIVVHSHPYSGTANHPGHTHTTMQLLAIAQLPVLLAPDDPLPELGGLFFVFAALAVVFCPSGTTRDVAFHYCRRGPPAC